MTNAKATKRALLSSALALFLCCAMLIGTTFAWFTDSVTSANNIIKSGNLDIKLEYWDGDSWEDVNGKSDILTNTLWEPGVTEVAYFRIKNAGSLALKYQFGVNIVKETPGKNVEGKDFLLSDYIYFDMIEGVNGETAAYATREDAIAAVTDAKKISAGYAKADTLLAGSDYVYLAMVVYMPTTVGNEANHNGIAPEIDLGINIMATQLAAEEDSFGPDYDDDVVYADVIVTNEAELKEALANANNGAVIGIKGNVTWTTGAGIGSTPFVESASAAPYVLNVASGAEKTSYITLVGLTEDATFTAIGSGVGAIGIDNGTVIFKDLKIVDESVSYTENSWEYGYLEFRGNTVFENCDIVNAIMMEGTSATFKNCTFNSHKDSEYAVWVSDGEASFEDCYFTGTRGIKIHEAYGSEVVSVAVNNSTFADLTKKPGIAIGDLNAETTVIVKNNIFAGTQAGDQGLYIYETDTDVSKFNFVVDDNTVAGYADNNDELKAAVSNATDGGTIVVAGGTYTFPASSIKAGTTIICEEGTVFNGKTGLNINGATVVGATFSNPNGTAGAGTINGTFKNCVFEGSEALRWCYAGETVVFENCEFKTDFRGVHFDGMDHNVIFKNCKLNGFNAFGGTATVTFEGCTFGYDESGYNGLNMYCDTVLKDCKFEYVSDKTNFIDMEGIGKTLTITNCTATLDGEEANVLDFVGGSKLNQNTLIVDGALYVIDAAGLEKAVKAGAKAVILAEGDYALHFTNHTNFNLNDMTIKGLGDVNLAISSTEAWYGRVQGSNVTFENIHFTSSVGATGKATYNDCTFDSWAICASSNKEETTFNNCTINGCLNTSTDFSSGDVFVNNCKIAKAEYSGSMTMNFVDCQIGEIIIWNANTNLTNCKVTKLDDSNVTTATVTIK